MYNAIGKYVGMPQWAGLNDPPLGNNEPEDHGRIKSDAYWGKYKNGLFTKTVFYCRESKAVTPLPWYGVSYGESLYLQPPNGNNLTGGGNPKAWSFPRRANAIKYPSSKIHVADGNSSHLDIITNVGVTNNFDLTRHMGGVNILFVDGHVNHYKESMVKGGISRAPGLPASASVKSTLNFSLD
jgi:prepilin-type processing-associated H-X9-DG protein